MDNSNAAEQFTDPSDSNHIRDVYFLDSEMALQTACKNNHLSGGNGHKRLQICYYDGLPIDNAPLNLIYVPSYAFADFFASTSLPLPSMIVCHGGIHSRAKVDIEAAFQQMLEEIESARRERIQRWDAYPHYKDSYFLDPRVAYHTAIQQNPVFIQHLTTMGLQVCYYDGTPIEDGPDNLIHVPAELLLDYLSNCRTRLPTELVYPAGTPLEEIRAGTLAFKELLLKAKHNRAQYSEEFAQRILNQKPRFVPGEPFRVFFMSDYRTQVLQYVSKNLAKAFVSLGHEARISIEENAMENIDFPWHFKEQLEFNPHLTINLNLQHNRWLHEDVFNVIWYQDPEPDIREGNALYWRDRDIVLSISPEIDEYLMQCGAPSVERQFSCIDHEVFKPMEEITRHNKVVFIGSSYINCKYADSHADSIIAGLKETLDAGQLIDKKLCEKLAREHHVEIDKIWPYTANYVIRDTIVQWLCQNPLIPVEVYGRYWERDPIVAPYFKGELMHGVDVAKTYNEAKYAVSALTLAINSQRLAELAGCGCIPVVYDTREAADKPHWDNECLYFKTREELYACLVKTPPGNPTVIADAYRYDSLAKKLIAKMSEKLPR